MGTELIRQPAKKTQLTKELLVQQISMCKEAITKNLGIIEFCQNLLLSADLPESTKSQEKTDTKEK